MHERGVLSIVSLMMDKTRFTELLPNHTRTSLWGLCILGME